jgi:hypothetical protein
MRLVAEVDVETSRQVALKMAKGEPVGSTETLLGPVQGDVHKTESNPEKCAFPSDML